MVHSERSDGKPQSQYALTEAVFLRLLGLVYLVAFGSLWPQILALSGSHGIVPAERIIQSLKQGGDMWAFIYAPTLFWFGISDRLLVTCCITGCFASLGLIIGRLPRSFAGLCFVLYLSLVIVGQPFSSFQWDALLLESGFLALFARTPLLVWAYRLLLIRLMFESGLVKLLSGDPNWRNLHALRYHFLTQPLPNPIAYYVHRAPPLVLDGMTFLALALELVAPWLLLATRRVRYAGVILLIFLQLMILLTGNFAFFNLLTISLCCWGLDDSVFSPFSDWLRRAQPISRIYINRTLQTFLMLLIAIGALQLIQFVAPSFGRPITRIFNVAAEWQIVNRYGLFAVMTTTRPELVIEGSDDEVTWREYGFRYKPGELHRGLPLVAPYQPRLDWQMWFASLGSYGENPWVGNLLIRILTGEPAVTKLMEPPPFGHPPRYVRVLRYDYDFTRPSDRARSGAVWQRSLESVWLGPVSLSDK